MSTYYLQEETNNPRATRFVDTKLHKTCRAVECCTADSRKEAIDLFQTSQCGATLDSEAKPPKAPKPARKATRPALVKPAPVEPVKTGRKTKPIPAHPRVESAPSKPKASTKPVPKSASIRYRSHSWQL